MHFSFFPYLAKEIVLILALQKTVEGVCWPPTDFYSYWEFSEISMRLKSQQFITILVPLPDYKRNELYHKADTLHVCVKMARIFFPP